MYILYVAHVVQTVQYKGYQGQGRTGANDRWEEKKKPNADRARLKGPKETVSRDFLPQVFKSESSPERGYIQGSSI